MDSKPVTKSKSEVSFSPSQEPFPTSDGSGEPPRENGDSSSLPRTSKQAEPASHKGPEDACQQRISQPPSDQNPPRNPLSSNDTSPANATGTEGLEVPDTNDLSSPARPQGQQATSPSKEDEKQAHIKRQLMTNFILGSFDDNSSDEDPGAGLFRESSRKGSRASLGALSLEAALTAGESDTLLPIIR